MRFFAFSEEWPLAEESHPPKIQPCARDSLDEALFTRLRLTGPGWRNRTGVEVSEPLPARHRRAVKQRFATKRFGRQQLTLWFELDQQGRVKAIVADMFWPD